MAALPDNRGAILGIVGVGVVSGSLAGFVLFSIFAGLVSKPVVYESTAQAIETDEPLIVNIGDQVYSRTKCGLDEQGWQDLAGVIVRAGYRFTVQIFRNAYGHEDGYNLYNQVKPELISGGLLAEKGGGAVDVTELGKRAFKKLNPTTPL